ncbi:MAG TPA: ATP-binding cassette domain-containing protein [Sedimentisphaerales bacterium]|nr:ATP-binding cassette domain-containing protein [Sedimentisphaerales bacterium]
MGTYCVSKTFGFDLKLTEKSSQTMRMFGLTVDKLQQSIVTHECKVRIRQGDVVYITGPSGSGKSVLLRELEKKFPSEEKISLQSIKLPSDKSVIDCISGTVVESLKSLSIAGLNDCFCILNRPAYLSDGQKYRFALAQALAADKKVIFADEFCTNLDRITASVIAWNIRKFAKNNEVTFILASCHDDILEDLSPDVLILKSLSGEAEVIYKQGGEDE